MKKDLENNHDYGGEYVDRIIMYIRKNRMQSFYNLVLLLIIMIQLPFMIAGLDSVTVEVDLPPRGQIVVKNDSANKLYYQLWTEHFTNDEKYFFVTKDGKKQEPYTYSLLSFDYTNVEEKYSTFLKKYKQSKLLKDMKIYQSFIKNIKVKMISQTYSVERIETEIVNDGRSAVSTVYGVAHQKAASTEMAVKECKYTFTYERIGGKIYATSLNTDCF